MDEWTDVSPARYNLILSFTFINHVTVSVCYCKSVLVHNQDFHWSQLQGEKKLFRLYVPGRNPDISPLLLNMLAFDSICNKQWILHLSAKPNLTTIITFSLLEFSAWPARRPCFLITQLTRV